MAKEKERETQKNKQKCPSLEEKNTVFLLNAKERRHRKKHQTTKNN